MSEYDDFLSAFVWDFDCAITDYPVKRLEAALKVAQQFVHPYDEPEDDPEEDPFADMFPDEEDFDKPLPEYFQPIDEIENYPESGAEDPEFQDAVQDTLASILKSHDESRGNQWYEWSKFLHRPEQWDEDQFEVIQALSVFTGGPRSGISQIRFPGNDKSLKEYKSRLGETFEGVAKQPFRFTESSVNSATKILTAMASNPQGKDLEVFRGARIPVAVAEKYQVGDILDMGNVSSWSIDSGVSANWATIRDVPGARPTQGVLFYLQNSQRGTYIGDVSRFPFEQEFLTGGEVQIIGIEDSGNFLRVDVKQL